MKTVRLLDIAHARSGDKGDTCNVGVIGRSEKVYPLLLKYLTEDVVKHYFAGMVMGRVERFELANLWAVNFLLHNALGGGGTVSLKLDAQGKTYAAAILRMTLTLTDEEFQSIQ
jgi:hypothetical protein